MSKANASRWLRKHGFVFCWVENLKNAPGDTMYRKPLPGVPGMFIYLRKMVRTDEETGECNPHWHCSYPNYKHTIHLFGSAKEVCIESRCARSKTPKRAVARAFAAHYGQRCELLNKEFSFLRTTLSSALGVPMPWL